MLFVELSERDMPENAEDIPLTVLVPAFMISELRRAFEIGFLLFLPFIVIDLVVASVLDVDGHDDAAAGDHLAAVQADLLCAGGWLEPARWQPDTVLRGRIAPSRPLAEIKNSQPSA
jgi:hypothetical protein